MASDFQIQILKFYNYLLSLSKNNFLSGYVNRTHESIILPQKKTCTSLWRRGVHYGILICGPSCGWSYYTFTAFFLNFTSLILDKWIITSSTARYSLRLFGLRHNFAIYSYCREGGSTKKKIGMCIIRCIRTTHLLLMFPFNRRIAIHFYSRSFVLNIHTKSNSIKCLPCSLKFIVQILHKFFFCF